MLVVSGYRRGLECPSRDYYPYWAPSPWQTVMVMTNNLAMCPIYQQESQNVKTRGYCSGANGNGDVPWSQQVRTRHRVAGERFLVLSEDRQQSQAAHNEILAAQEEAEVLHAFKEREALAKEEERLLASVLEQVGAHGHPSAAWDPTALC